MTRRPQLKKHHAFFHILIMMLGWGIYGGIAYTAFQGILWTLVIIAIIATGSALFLIIIAHTWSRLHQYYHRTKNKRIHIPRATLQYDKDWLGYTIDSEVEAIKKAKFITIEAIEERKDKSIIHKKQYRIEETS